MKFYNNCVNWPHDDVHVEGGLCDMIDARVQVTRHTFVRQVDTKSREQIEALLGYAPHCPDSVLTMTRDYHVTYYRSVLHGQRVYFFKHSAIEYVFKS